MNSGKGSTFKPLKQFKFSKRVKIPKLLKIVKPKKIFKLLKKLFKTVFRSSSPRPILPCREDGHDPFMACMIKVDTTKWGWHRSVLRIKASCKRETRFQMDPEGNVMVAGIGDPDKLIRKLGRSRRAKLVQIQYGSCSRNMFLPPVPKPKPEPEPKPNQQGNSYSHPHPRMPYGDPYYHQRIPTQLGYGCNPRYQQPLYLGNGYNPPGLPLPFSY